MPTKDQPKQGRSQGYGAKIAETICDRLGEGESLRAICTDPAMPAKATVCRWLARNPEFRRQYALARQFQAERFADEMLNILDDCSDIRHACLRIGALKLVAARMTPRKYGNH
jgi:hypothetical protein